MFHLDHLDRSLPGDEQPDQLHGARPPKVHRQVRQGCGRVRYGAHPVHSVHWDEYRSRGIRVVQLYVRRKLHKYE